MMGELNQIFSQSETAFLLDYRGLTVEQLSELRQALIQADAGLRVVKNRIAKLAVEDTPFVQFKEHFVQPRALVFGKDIAAPAKALKKYLNDFKQLEYIDGCLVTDGEGRTVDLSALMHLGSLPSREELLIKILFLLNAPPRNLVRTLNEVPSKLVRVLAAAASKKGGK